MLMVRSKKLKTLSMIILARRVDRVILANWMASIPVMRLRSQRPVSLIKQTLSKKSHKNNQGKRRRKLFLKE